MNILSLFDGISCGQLALQRAAILYKNYYASEVDKFAIKVTQHHFPDTHQLGDVTKLDYSNLPSIDLLIGGSPCQGFSLAGKQLNFQDTRSKLFFEYVKALKELKPKYFFFENVKMAKPIRDAISLALGVDPIELNSSLVSKQNRRRLYWTNIPYSEAPVDLNLNFDQYIYQLPHGFTKEEIRFVKKHPTLRARTPAANHRLVIDKAALTAPLAQVRSDSSLSRPLTPEECEELQTLPISYTSIISKTQRYKAIGNGWTVDIIAHFFRHLNNNTGKYNENISYG